MKTYQETPPRIKAILTGEFSPIRRRTLTQVEYRYHQWWYRVLFHATPVYTLEHYRDNRSRFLRGES